MAQRLFERLGMGFDEFVARTRKRECGEPTAARIWRGEYEDFEQFADDDMQLSNLCKAAFVLIAATALPLPR